MTEFEHDEKKKFMLGDVFNLTLNATIQRSNLYKSNVPENKKNEFHKALRESLEKLAKTYFSKVHEKDHVRNIQNLSEEMSNRFKEIFKDEGFRIGLAQKALNLYLKYRWCMGEIEMPLHCPVDSIVLNEAGISRKEKWTEIKSIDKYNEIISKIREKAGANSLAEWELEVWNRKKGYM